MNLRNTLLSLANLIADQADNDPVFSRRVNELLSGLEQKKPAKKTVQASDGRPKNRRPAPVLDPIATLNEGEEVLRVRLSKLSLEELKDIVADYGMDPGKLVMKWKIPEKVIDRIVEISKTRAQKGDAFRSD